ncbi:MAG TPA: hypothetical protein PKI01_05080 [Bacteroidales bacterium]|nr:hypothetical protein [Bacteroidales bacterium]
MKIKTLKTVLLFGVAALIMAFDLPTGWFKAGDKPNSYDMGIDKGAGRDGKNAATIKSIEKNIKGFGTLMQNCLPGKFLGKRVRMAGYMKTKDVTGWAAFWLRIDTKEKENNMPFDDMHGSKNDRSVKGTTDWARYEIVLDVPLSAEQFAYGALLNGTGQLWFDDITFEIVDNTVKTTGFTVAASEPPVIPGEPVNLDFEK